jgi:DNA polymerase III alpha subunit
MSHADFVHLHLHTEYSLLDGACRLDRLVDKAHEGICRLPKWERRVSFPPP